MHPCWTTNKPVGIVQLVDMPINVNINMLVVLHQVMAVDTCVVSYVVYYSPIYFVVHTYEWDVLAAY